ncbi:hypothetical protein B0T16DRAFT_444555 [Cercophora newfieldiana]|uniref:Uncharacterized protein n=1 Tax=Cercophora newfieldiana TaxID=92897 RepID=A0AA39YBN3_9PEZI|nr:hypothetical protein B0T16DRAFT_444555 [Cercophora newfieldiana]
MAAIGTIAKTTEIAKVLPRSLSAGQIAAIAISVTVIVIGGFGAYAYFQEREKDDDDGWTARLRSWVARGMRQLKAKVAKKTEAPEDQEKLAPGKAHELDGDWSAEMANGIPGGVEGAKELPWDEKYLPVATR